MAVTSGDLDSLPRDGSVTPPRDPATSAHLQALLVTEAVERASDHVLATDERTLAEQVVLTQIPAPPFGEEARGRRMAELMGEAGLTGVEIDEVGNVRGWYPHPGPGPAPLVLSAHLDTVFPEGTDVRLRRSEDGLLEAPGISDDGRGLAAILAVSRALAAGGIRLRRPLMVVATVGEEGVGDLRGVRHLTGPGGAAVDARAFLSLDGAGHELVVNESVGSRRFRVTVQGQGGHSWMDYGVANPLHALGRSIAALDGLERSGDATLSVGRAGGGTSINAIPEEAWMEFELRSRSEDRLEDLEARARAALARAVDDVNARRARRSRALRLEVSSLGHRPGGRTLPQSAVVRAAVAATRGVGRRPRLAASSTDSNVPMARGIPAVTLGAGGTAGKVHTLDEWYRNDGGPEGILRALYTVLLLDELG